jgi:transcriptional regulator with XRE-family HTH domain
MEREKPTFDILSRIERERLSRGWSEYALAENSGLTQSTISTWRRRNLQPNVASLEKICSGLGISLSQFFQEEDSVYLTSDQKELLDLWAKLSPAQRTAVSQMLRSFLRKRNKFFPLVSRLCQKRISASTLSRHTHFQNGCATGALAKIHFRHARLTHGLCFCSFLYKIKFNYSAAKYGQAHEGLDRFIILNNRF